MTASDESLTPEERETVKKLKAAHIEDDGLPEDLAEARALAEVNRLAGRMDHSFDAHPETEEKNGYGS
ncbi:MAG: hypothetical protein QM627_03235 [Luteolibacter sp.]